MTEVQIQTYFLCSKRIITAFSIYNTYVIWLNKCLVLKQAAIKDGSLIDLHVRATNVSIPLLQVVKSQLILCAQYLIFL